MQDVTQARLVIAGPWSAGSSSRRMKCAGVRNVVVTRWRSTSRRNLPRPTDPHQHDRATDVQRGVRAHPPGPAWYIGPGREMDVVAR